MDLLDLFVKIGVKDEASDKVSKLSGKLGKGLKAAGKIGIAAVSAAASAVGALTGAAIKNYAEYEQLVGGVETLFKDNADTVQQYAANAYKTAGLSANDYMETVTSFSASLLQSLDGDTAAAAQKADLAITDMSDNANKMGTDMGMIQNAYQGFAKQNFMMLDNLKLGYGGTKTEMERLLADATELSGVEYDISSYADIVDAIHVVQTELGITGTTAKEASTTISGSVHAMKGAWANLLVGIADDNADFGSLMNDFVDSAGVAAENILPRIEIALNGIGTAIDTILPPIMERLPEIIMQVLPKLVSAGVKIISSLITGIFNNLPALFDMGGEIIHILIDGAVELFGDLFGLGEDTIQQIKDGIWAAWDGLKSWFKGIWDSLFGNLDVNVNVAGKAKSGTSGGGNVRKFATGLDYVPYDEFPAYLHKGEMVLTASEASAYRQGGKPAEGVTIIQNISVVPQTPVEFAAITAKYAEEARWSFA